MSIDINVSNNIATIELDVPPVNAVDSTLGVVTKAYQMILPSLNDSGAEKIVISPFSTLSRIDLSIY